MYPELYKCDSRESTFVEFCGVLLKNISWRAPPQNPESQNLEHLKSRHTQNPDIFKISQKKYQSHK
jgi:hypothetical protein